MGRPCAPGIQTGDPRLCSERSNRWICTPKTIIFACFGSHTGAILLSDRIGLVYDLQNSPHYQKVSSLHRSALLPARKMMLLISCHSCSPLPSQHAAQQVTTYQEPGSLGQAATHPADSNGCDTRIGCDTRKRSWAHMHMAGNNAGNTARQPGLKQSAATAHQCASQSNGTTACCALFISMMNAPWKPFCS
jgi:hypothetical protein